MTAGLFADTMADPWAAYPPALVQDTTEHREVRYSPVGEENERLVFLGHPDPNAVIRAACHYLAVLADPNALTPVERHFVYTWARGLTCCPRHKNAKDGCEHCGMDWLEFDWYLDWSVPKGKPLDHHKDTGGYFPVVLWAVPA